MPRSDARPRVTIITPVFNEVANLHHYAEVVRTTLLEHPRYQVRVLFVDDGSRDNSWRIIQEIASTDGRFQGIRLSRNFGSHIAITAGIAHARGDAIATLACDLQDPPEVILEFLREWEGGARVVWGKRRTRNDAGWRIGASRLFENLSRRFAMPPESKFTTGSFLLIDRKVANCFRQFRETNRITFALVAWTGFEQAIVEYDRRPRIAGVSSWKLRQLLKTSYDMFVGFSSLPIRMMTALGAGLSLLAAGLSIYLLVGWLFGQPRPGWTSLMFCMAFFFGLQFLLMSVLGEYLYRIYSETVQRPLFFIADRTRQPKKESSRAA